jgi:hypothetical protein
LANFIIDKIINFLLGGRGVINLLKEGVKEPHERKPVKEYPLNERILDRLK